MPEEEVKSDKPKGPLGKLKAALLPDQDEQAAIFVHLYDLEFLCGPAGY